MINKSLINFIDLVQAQIRMDLYNCERTTD